MKQCERCGADMGAKVCAWIDADTGQSKLVCKKCLDEVTRGTHSIRMVKKEAAGAKRWWQFWK